MGRNILDKCAQGGVQTAITLTFTPKCPFLFVLISIIIFVNAKLADVNETQHGDNAPDDWRIVQQQ